MTRETADIGWHLRPLNTTNLPLHWQVRLIVGTLTLWGAVAAWRIGPPDAATWAVVGLLLMLACLGEQAARHIRRIGGASDLIPPSNVAFMAHDPVVSADRQAWMRWDLTDPAQFRVFYRPLRTLPALAIRGVEAELRWCRPDRGWLSPNDWPAPLPDPVKCALMRTWLAAACRQFAAWQAGLDTMGGGTLWLRLPPALVDAPGLDDLVERALVDARVAPSRLRVCLHAQAGTNEARLPAVAPRLQARGLPLVLDGFGAGPASLAQLQDLTLRAVCLDRTLVERTSQAGTQRLVVESTAWLTETLGIPLLADGVASEAQAHLMGALGCSLGAGEACGGWLNADDGPRSWGLQRLTAPD